MVGSISSASMMMPTYGTNQSSSNSSSLTSSQKETISSVLGQFDSENLTTADAKSIVKSFSEAGITPSSELASAMEKLGFDAKEVGDLAGVPRGGGNMPPPPPSGDRQQEEESVSSLLESLLSIDDEEESSATATSFDDIMEYTSRILNLNESSKSDLMSLLETYENGNSGYSKEESTALIKNSLSTILSDSNNYNRVSIYA